MSRTMAHPAPGHAPMTLPIPPTLRAANMAKRMAGRTKPGVLHIAPNDRAHILGLGKSAPGGALERAASTAPNARPAMPSFFEMCGAINIRNTRIHSKGIVFGDVIYNMELGDFLQKEDLGQGHYGAVRLVLYKPTGTFMAMKETNVSFDDKEVERIMLELDILHKAKAPNIVDFYGAFTVESRVFSVMEYMDAGSLDKLTFKPGAIYKIGDEEVVWDAIPEDVLARISAGIVRGLKALKDDLDVMHRDVKPTNILMNTKGQVKLCDFGVSKQLELSMAKTNIGCQNYMAPERIQGESRWEAGEYSVAADVWSLGLSIIEIAMGEYPYPSHIYNNVFAQLEAILRGDLPTLPDGYSSTAGNWVERCLDRNDKRRASYVALLEHPFLKDEGSNEVDVAGWVKKAMRFKGAKCVREAPVVVPET